MKELIPIDWLLQNLTNDDLVILDASPLKTMNDESTSHISSYIPGSRIFNIKDHFTNKESEFPNTIPSSDQFEKACRLLGINVNSKIIVYDNLGIYSSPRVWWLFKVMGHQNIGVLNGGLPEWIRCGGEVVGIEDLNRNYSNGNFESDFRNQYLITYQDIIDNNESKRFLIVDARSSGRFLGISPEPRKHLKSGSIPNSVNIPYQSLLKDGKFKSKEELNTIFKSKINNQDQLVFSCGSGMTACIVMLASVTAFRKSQYLYDGSWTEYAELKK